ncbi:hypothetical protein [Flavivirga rizhaonensis]|uniref:Alpha/beta hydrolase n=1 Tax=Flavivirga rizhaonensis TaxID=2559571 RepID=A0A4S1DVT9_9FLAO|nr:hypothetical protein [Flavivirga rizhaonensis]TGV02217.1 hypothetical protein EM932_11755 [Flavivirga rizhaonensis]
MKQLLIILIVLISIHQLQGQTVEFQEDNKTYRYKKLNNPTNCKGLLVLFGYNGGNGVKDIPLVFEKDGVLIILIVMKTNFFKSHNNIDMVDACITHALDNNNIPSKSLLYDGFSRGATEGLRYAESVIERQITKLIPKGIFSGDANLDYLEFYKYCEREIVRVCDAPKSIIGKKEAEIIKNEYDKELGNPIVNRDNYIKASAVTITEPDFGNAKYLLNIPIRYYHEVAPMWYIKEKCRNQFSEENIYVGTALINYLYNNGNKKAEIIITQNKGYRTNGKRHPHSWSIIDTQELLDWHNNIE